VVTEFEFRLHPVPPTVLAADFVFDLDHAAVAMRRWAELIPEAPRLATLTAWAGQDPEGRPQLSLGYIWIGDRVEGRRLLPAFRALGPVMTETVRDLSYLELQSIDDVPAAYGKRRYWKGHYLTELGDGAIDAFLLVATSRGGQLHGSLQTYGGAIADVGDDESAFSQRHTLVEFVAGTGWTDAGEDQAQVEAARRYGAAIEPFASGAYVNALADEGDEGVRRAYPAAKLARLVALKDRYDPGNVFHLNHNIAPSPARG
jgi:FAD/FMN-containing dehydrogenase